MFNKKSITHWFQLVRTFWRFHSINLQMVITPHRPVHLKHRLMTTKLIPPARPDARDESNIVLLAVPKVEYSKNIAKDVVRRTVAFHYCFVIKIEKQLQRWRSTDEKKFTKFCPSRQKIRLLQHDGN